MKRGLYRRLLKELRGFIPAVVISLVCAYFTVRCSLSVPLLQGNAVDSIIGPGEVDFDKLEQCLKKMCVIVTIGGAFMLVMNRINYYVTNRIVKNLRDKAFCKLSRLSFQTLDKYSRGDILSRITSDAESIGDGLLMGFNQLFTGIVTIFCTIEFMVRIEWIEAVLVIVLTPLSFLVAKFVASRTFRYFEGQSKARGRETAFVQEIIENQKLVKSFDYGDKAAADFEELNESLRHYSKRAAFFSSLVNPTSRAVNNIIYALVALTGALLVIHREFSVGGIVIGGMTIGNLTSFLSYTMQYSKPFNEISGVVTELQNAFACAGRLFEIIDEKEEEPVKNPLPLENANGHIVFDSVDFSYDKSKRLIENLSLDVRPGQKVAIVGPTGAGKTTIIQLLMKFYNPDLGRIILDDKPLERLENSDVRENFGMVLQDTWIRHGTVRENLLLGRENISDEELVNAAKKSGAHGFIKRLLNGYDTVLSSGGEDISQGQRQLLCITRVMLDIPPMLILDEATSSIDTRTELKIQAAFGTMMKGRTTFIVAHRLSTIRSADVILVVRNGNVVETGTHDELLKKRGFYYELHMAQYE